MMISTKLQWFLLCLVSGVLIPAVQGISYREWAATPAAAPISILLEPVSNGCVAATQPVNRSQRGHDQNYSDVPSRPSGGYLGQIVIRQQAGARMEFPLTVFLSFPNVNVEDLLPPAGQSHSNATTKVNLKWHLPMGLLNPDSPVQPEQFRRSRSIARLSPADRVTMPLLLPGMMRGGFRPGGNNANMFSCLCEIRDARGTVLLRKQMIELFYGGNGYNQNNTAWVMNEPEADRYLRESVGINTSFTIRELPPLMEPYAEIDALWVSAEAVQTAAINQDMLRRLLLMGTWIFGRSATISNLTAMAGISGPGSVLLGGIQPLGKKSEDEHQALTINHADSLWDNSANNSNNGKTNAAPVMENRRDLFQPLKSWYSGWTLSVLGIFFGVACIGLPIAFWRLKGSRRLVLWWLIPAVTISIGIVSLVGGKWLLPREPRADITEYRFAYADWPEVFCRSVNRSLTFEERQVVWSLPNGSFVFPARSRSNSVGPEWIDESAGRVVHGIAGLKRGQIAIDETAGFRSLPLPVAIGYNMTNHPELKVLAPLRQVHVLENGSWYRVGDVQAGQVIMAPFGAKTNAIFGLPDRIAHCFPSFDFQPGVCKNCGKVHEVDKNLAMAFSNTWIVAALSVEPAAAKPTMKNTRTESRAVWFIQIPMHPKISAPGDRGNKPK